MAFKICLLLLVAMCLENGETGGHGGKHHDHVNVHVPEFIHHDHHTKVITIHHHHHKPKKEHHHHHHHHHKKPHIPHGHHYHHHKKAHTTLKTETTKHGHGHGHGHHGHHGHHHKSHGHHHHDTPSYDPPRIPAYEDEYASYNPPAPSYNPPAPSYNPPAPSYPKIGHQSPRVHGVTHTVKQVKVFDSLPGVIPNAGNSGYEVTENGADEEEDVFTSVNGLQQSYPATYGYLRGAAEQPTHDPFAELTPQGATQTNNHDPFAGVIPQPTVTLTDGHNFQGHQHDPFASSNPTENIGLIIQPSDFPAGFDGNSGIDQPTSFVGTGGDNSVYLANEENSISDGPVSFSREAGIQHSMKTGGVETLLY